MLKTDLKILTIVTVGSNLHSTCFDFDCNTPLSDVGCEVFINSELKINNNASEHNHDGPL